VISPVNYLAITHMELESDRFGRAGESEKKAFFNKKATSTL